MTKKTLELPKGWSLDETQTPAVVWSPSGRAFTLAPTRAIAFVALQAIGNDPIVIKHNWRSTFATPAAMLVDNVVQMGDVPTEHECAQMLTIAASFHCFGLTWADVQPEN